MAEAKPIFDAGISYRTPSGRRVYYSQLVAAESAESARPELLARLESESKFGRRKVARVLDDYSARFVTMQIGKPSAVQTMS